VRIDCALLCDAATVREGLLHVLGGGVTRAGRPQFPSPLGLTLALRILIHPTEADRPHNLEVRLQGEDGQLTAKFELEFGVGDPSALEPTEHASLPLPLPLPPQVQLPTPGRYSFELLIDGIHQASVPFIAHLIEGEEELPQPGQPPDEGGDG
jgi:hypothetical protein